MICPECGKRLTDEDAYGHDCEVFVKTTKENVKNMGLSKDEIIVVLKAIEFFKDEKEQDNKTRLDLRSAYVKLQKEVL